MTEQNSSEWVMAQTLWGEARGEPLAGKVAVANVIMTRFKNPCWWSRNRGDGIPDDTIEAVCKDPWQFSCWNKDDPNRSKIEALTTADSAFRECLTVAQLAIEGLLADKTDGATHYHHEAIMPSWVINYRLDPCYRVGGHLFYNDVP